MNLEIVPHVITDFGASEVVQFRHTVKRLELPEEFGAETMLHTGKAARYCTAMHAIVAIQQIKPTRPKVCHPLPSSYYQAENRYGPPAKKAREPVRVQAGELLDGVHSAHFVGEPFTRGLNTLEEAAMVGEARGRLLSIPEFILMEEYDGDKLQKLASLDRYEAAKTFGTPLDR